VTALDDALASPSTTWVRPNLKAYWDGFETPLGAEREDLGPQLGEQLTLEHSLNDGLPDPVTMTSQSNASGALSADLIGREELIAHAPTIGWRTSAGFGSSSASTFTVQTIPSDIDEGDMVICAVAVPSAVVVSTINEDYELVGTYSDGASLAVYVFAGVFTAASSQFVASFSGNSRWAMVISAMYAYAIDGRRVPLALGTIVGVAESASVTSHSAPSATLSRRGMVASVWARLSSTTGWVPADTELAEAAGTGGTDANVSLSRTDLKLPDGYVTTATTPTATSTAVMISIPIEVVDRPAMTAREYFSPFNTTSPVYGLDRDVAPVELDWGTLTADGPEYTTIMVGQMADIEVQGDSAQLQAVSDTRLDLMASVQPPVVWAKRERANATWLMTWLMSQAGLFLSYRPGLLTRIWAPLYGSVHAHFEGPGGYSYAVREDAIEYAGQRPPLMVEGPFVRGMYACMLADEYQMIVLNMSPSQYTHPALADTYNEGFAYDQMSQSSYEGRIQCYVRGDATQTAVGFTPYNASRLWEYTLRLRQHTTSLIDAQVTVYIRTSDRKLVVLMGDDTAGFLEVASTLVLPTDGEWHFIGFSWDWSTGETRFRMDTSDDDYDGSGFVTTDANLPESDADYIAAGNFIDNLVYSKLPLSELQVESGTASHFNPFMNDYPLPDNAVARTLDMELEVIAEPAPRDLWTQLVELAQANAASYRCSEVDTFMFLPLSYFGETAQMTPQVVVLDTDQNASSISARQDPSKTRNLVTVEFTETTVDDIYYGVLDYSTSIKLPRGKTTIQFSLDTPAAEIHLAPSRRAPVSLTALTSGQVATPSTIPNNIHYFSANTKADGTGNYTAGVTAKLVEATAFTVTIEFSNGSSGNRYIVNNGDSVPFIHVQGYRIHTGIGYETRRDDTSIELRRERSLSTQALQIQGRVDAGQFASSLVAMLCRPRAEISITVVGDPRRAPGQLVTIADQQGTKAEGTWRIMSCVHHRNNAQYTQDLQLVLVLPPSEWDGIDGWDYGVWSE